MSNPDHEFDELVGNEFDFYGVDGTCFKLDDAVYEAVEGAGLEEIRICQDVHSFHELPIARIVVENGSWSDDTVYDLIDLHDGHCWLSLGTEYLNARCSDPTFVFDYFPKGGGCD